MKIITDEGLEIVPSRQQKEAICHVLNHHKNTAPKITLDALYEIVSNYLHVDNYDVRRRPRHLVYPRQIFSIIAHKALGYSLKETGARIGGLDHTSIIHAIESLKKLLASEEIVRKDLDSVCAIVGVVNPMIYQLPKRPEILTLLPTEKPKKEYHPPKEIFIRPKADHTNRNYLQEYGV